MGYPDQIEDTIRHYCRINRITRPEFDRDFKNARAQWKQRSKLNWKIDWGQFAPIVTERRAYLARPSVKLRLDPATDSEPIEPSPFPKRGPRPLFGRAMTNAEMKARSRALKKQAKLDYQDYIEMNAIPAVWVDLSSQNDKQTS